MSPLKPARRTWQLLPYALAVAVPAALVLGGRHGDNREPADWTTADLLRKLEPLGLRAVPANRAGPPSQRAQPGPEEVWEDGAYLTTTGLGWEELSALHKAAVPSEAAMARWRGTVLVRPYRSPRTRSRWPAAVPPR